MQLGTLSDVTRATTHVTLLDGTEDRLTLLELIKWSFCRIIFTLVESAIYNVFDILLLGRAFAKLCIPPLYAGLGEIVRVLLVIIVASSLARKQRNH
jgi:Cd2+-exporting ATPase